MRIAIRMDDITPDMDWEKFYRFKTILDRFDIKPLIGVVPDNKDLKLQIGEYHENFWEEIKSLRDNGWVIAMHGLNHLYTTDKGGLFPLNHKSEFAGYSLEQQDEMIKNGKEILEGHGISTDIFMAPSHSYDNNTLQALRNNGFKKITDGFGKAPYRRNGMIFYPISSNRASVLKDSGEGVSTFVVHTNTMNDKDFEYYEKVFTEHTFFSYGEYEKMQVADRGALGALSERATASCKFYYMKLRKALK